MDQIIIEDLKNGHFEITVHAAIRMSERVVTKEDLREIGRTVTSIKSQESPNAPYRVRGKDLEGEIMEVICDYIDKTLIVTVLTKEELI
ncbi:MAG: DUF4258 domain-containing protein [Halobacteriovoraceae bacterium]|jgi:hypothetical protein|nr:DUF4258 domain-containing protein [Halobacteriovoraceae bacterium]